ncbi:MAG: hypothetical protein ABF242_00940 [Flavobacteriales bacterium]
MDSKYTGKYTKAFLSDKKAKSQSIEYEYFNRTIDVKENEMVYIFSFNGNKLLFAKGYENILGISDSELDILHLNSLFTSYYERFVFEFHDRLLLFLYNNNNNIEDFSSNVITELEGFDIPVMINVKIHRTDDNGNLISIIGRNVADQNLKTSDVIQYSVHIGSDSQFISEINNDLDFKRCISLYNILVIEKMDKGIELEVIAEELNITTEKLQENLDKILTRFELKDYKELTQFAKIKHIIPNQFEKYL